MAKKQKQTDTVVTFRADDEVMGAIQKIAATIDVRGFAPRSIRAAAIRRALLDTAAKLNEKGDR